jgi:hypothetical protein
LRRERIRTIQTTENGMELCPEATRTAHAFIPKNWPEEKHTVRARIQNAWREETNTTHAFIPKNWPEETNTTHVYILNACLVEKYTAEQS